MTRPCGSDLELFKSALGQSAEESDALLLGYLTSAMLKVQDYADVSLMDCTCQLIVSERESNEPIRLYQSVSEVLTVTDGKGNALPYNLDGNIVAPAAYTQTVIVTYKTKAVEAEKLEHTPTVHRYATALYDGADAAELGRILVGC